MFQFNANIIKRRRASKRSLLLGMIAAALFGYFGLTFLELGVIPILEQLARQIGVTQYMAWVYAIVFIALILLMIPSIYTIMKKKVVVGGHVSFDEDKLEIVKGREKYIIPEEQLTQLDFDLKALPSGERKKKDQLFGGSYMKIPTKKGTFECELNINTPRQKEQLMEMIEFLKIEHDVKVNVNEVK